MPVLAVLGCAQDRDPIDRTQPNALRKTLFDGEWYYQQTVVDIPGSWSHTFVGETNWQGLERVLAMLASIARDETSGRPLSEPQRRWLSMVAENIPTGGYGGDSGQPPKWTGWYFDMFEDREHGATKTTSFIADYFTLTNSGTVAYLGAEGPRLGVFVVDTNGEPRAMVGPVARGFEAYAPIEGRLTDASVFEGKLEKRAPWRTSYAVDRPEPALGLEAHVVRCEKKGEASIGFGEAAGLVKPAPSI